MPLVIMAVIAPFERPLISQLGGFTLTTVEAAILVTLAGVFFVFAPRLRAIRASVEWRNPVVLSALAVLALFILSAAFAPDHQGNAIRFTARMVVAAIICFVAATVIDSRDRARLLVAAMLASAVLVAGLALLEAAQVPWVMRTLTAFRPGFHVVGGQLRASSTLLYPTIASMYLEIVFALGLWLLLENRTRSRSGLNAQVAIVFGALLVIAAGIIATFTRAGLIGMAAALTVVGGLHALRIRRLDRTHAVLAALALAIVGLVLMSRAPHLLLTRFRTEGSQDWYGAKYQPPESLRLTTGTEYQIPVSLINTGRIAWDSTTEPPFAMSYHWLRADTNGVVQFDGWRTPFPLPVAPGAAIELPVNVKAPGEPGKYVLVWDVVHEGRAWLSTEGITPARSLVEVTGRVTSEVITTMDRLPAASVRADRFTLWRAALRIAAERPWLGVGPDNYRLVYGPYAGLPRWDTRVTANNMYLEMLADTGVFGLAATISLIACAGVGLWRRWLRASDGLSLSAAVACAVWLMIVGHALVDTFLAFTTTYDVFAIAAGLIVSPGMRSDADRV